MAKYTRIRDDGIEQIAKRLVKTRFELQAVANSAVEIAYLKSGEPKRKNGRAVLGECERGLCWQRAADEGSDADVEAAS